MAPERPQRALLTPALQPGTLLSLKEVAKEQLPCLGLGAEPRTVPWAVEGLDHCGM